MVKVNAVERLRAELAAPRWRGEPIAMGTNTDPYQRAEGKYHLTQGIIGALAEAANPFSILTKSTLILRDLDLLVAAAARTSVRVEPVDRDARRRGVAHHRARHAPPAASGGGGGPAQRCRDPVRRAGGAGAAGPQRR